MRVRSLAVAALTATALLTGCSGGDGLPPSSSGVGFVAGNGAFSETPAGQRTIEVTLSGRTAEGDTVDLESLRGKPVVLNLWYADCAPCREEAPVLEQVSQEYAGRASFVGINSRDDADRILAFQKSRGTTYPSILDADGSALLALRGVAPKATPTTVVLDADGFVAAQFAGAIDATTLSDLIDGALDTGTTTNTGAPA